MVVGGGGGDGLDQAQVDARIHALVATQALKTDTDRWPIGKIVTGTVTEGHVLIVGANSTIVAGQIGTTGIAADAVTEVKLSQGVRDQLGGGGGGGGLSAVAHDTTLSGDGTSGDPLGVVTPFTAADETKLDGIETAATADQTGGEIVTAIDVNLGGATWQGGGGGAAFDLHDDVTTALTTLAGSDRFVVSDESAADDPNKYITGTNVRSFMRPASVTQADAEAGTITGLRTWSPARVAQAIAALADSGVTDYDDLTNIPVVNMDPAVASAATERVLIWNGLESCTRPSATVTSARWSSGALPTGRRCPSTPSSRRPASTAAPSKATSTAPTTRRPTTCTLSAKAPTGLAAHLTGTGIRTRPRTGSQRSPTSGTRRLGRRPSDRSPHSTTTTTPRRWCSRTGSMLFKTRSRRTGDSCRSQPIQLRLLPDPTGHSGDGLEVNSGGEWGFARFPTANDFIPHVGRIPLTVTAQDPDLVFLSHPYTIGNRSDATVTVGVDGSFVGYLHEGIVGVPVGSVDKVSPMVELRGFGSAGDYELDSVYAFNNGWLGDQQSIFIGAMQYQLGVLLREGGLWFRRILNAPTGLSAATLAVNFLNIEGAWYFTDGAELIEAGLWEVLVGEEGVLLYERLAAVSLTHSDEVGAPISPPTSLPAFHTDSLGRLWVGGSEIVINHTDPTGTDSAFLHPKYVSDPSTRSEILTTAGDGGFSWLINGGYSGFVQFVGTTPADYREGLIWHDIWNYMSEHVYPPDPGGPDHDRAQRYEDDGVFLGGLDSLDAALTEVSLRITDIGDFAADTFFWGDRTEPDDGLRVIDTFTLGEVTRITRYFWRGPSVVTADIASWINDHGLLVASSLDDALGPELAGQRP